MASTTTTPAKRTRAAKTAGAAKTVGAAKTAGRARTSSAARASSAAGSPSVSRTTSPAATTKSPAVVNKAVNKAVDKDATKVRMPVVGEVVLPPAEHLVFYVSIAAMTAIELLEWPVALVIGIGKILADNRSSTRLRAVGEAMEDAG